MSEFKEAMSKMGRQIDGRLILYMNPKIISEDAYAIVTEDDKDIITEIDQTPGSQALQTFTIYNEYIDSIQIIKNCNLLQTLMKQCNFETKDDLDLGTIFHPELGVLINNSYDYISYGDFIIYSKEYNAENNTYMYVAYDNMLRAMIKYTRLKVTYPTTVRDYLQAIANKLGLRFADADTTFTNYDKLIKDDYFVGKNVTYRDILDYLSVLTASNICASSYELYVGYPRETNDVITEDNLKDINVNFGKICTPINKINLIDKINNLKFSSQDDTSIKQYGLKEYNIINNPFMFNGEENEICQNILNRISNLSYSINNFSTTGLCYFSFLNLFTVSINNKNYKCLLLNNEITITQGIEENIFTEEIDNTQDESDIYQNISSSQNEADEINQDKVSKSNVINSINLSNEQNIIATNKIMLKKNITATTDINGFLDVNLDKNYIICSAIADFSNNDYGFIIPYYDYNNGNPIWKLKIEDKNNVALAETQISVVVYYFRK